MSKNRFIICGFLPVVYFLILMFFGDANCFISNILMATSLFITLKYIYDWDESAFSIVNFLCIIGLFVGFFSRYFVDIINSNRVTEFAPYPLESTVVGHIKSSAVTLVFVSLYAISYNYTKARRKKKGYSYENGHDNSMDLILSSNKCVTIYIIIEIICISYRFINMRLSTNLDYGTFDQFFRLIASIGKIFAYAFLYLYSRNKNGKHLLLFLLYVIPTFYTSFAMAWKGNIFIEIVMISIVFHTGIKRIKKRYIFLMILGVLLIFPIIGMIRDSYRYGTAVSYKLIDIIKYNSDNDFANYYINRFPYYDGLYYSINVDSSIVEQYNNEAGSIMSRFFSGLIPRIIWRDKPVVNVGSYVTYVLLRYPKAIYNNLTVGFLADAYLDGKVIGVFLAGLFFGLLVGKNENMRCEKKDAFSQAYYLVLGQALFGFWEGDIAAKMLGLIFAFLAYFITKFIINNRITIPSSAR